MKLLAIDLSNLVIRHAANKYRTETDFKNRLVGGAVGSIGQIISLIEEASPTHLLLARDGHRSSIFRKEINDNYKAHRPEANDHIKNNFSAAYNSLDVLGWPQISVDGFEADDIIGSAAKQFEGETLIVSGDKDLLALCEDSITVRLLRPGGYIDCSKDECFELIGVTPDLVCDYKALVGDQSDGISGIQGIGPKRALTLINNYGDLNGVIEAANNLNENETLIDLNLKVTQTVVAGIEDAKNSYQLATIVEDLEIDFQILDCPKIEPRPVLDDAQVEELNKFGLGPITKRLNNLKDEPKPKKDLADVFNSAFE
jgi:5'-3' exonuclease